MYTAHDRCGSGGRVSRLELLHTVVEVVHVELDQLVIDRAACEAGDVNDVDGVAEALGVEQGYTAREVVLLAAMRRGGEQQQVAGERV